MRGGNLKRRENLLPRSDGVKCSFLYSLWNKWYQLTDQNQHFVYIFCVIQKQAHVMLDAVGRTQEHNGVTGDGVGVLGVVVGFIVLEGGVDLTNGRAKMKLSRDILVVGCIQQINSGNETTLYLLKGIRNNLKGCNIINPCW